MTEKQSGSIENKEEVVDIDDFEVVISEVLNETIVIFNTVTSNIANMHIGYRIFQDYEKVSNLPFTPEDIEWLEKTKNPENVFIVGYKRDEASVYEIVTMSLKDFADALSGAIREGSFMAQHLYEILEDIKIKLCKNYQDGQWISISSELFNQSNSIIFKDETPILVVKANSKLDFYNILKREFDPTNIELVLNFAAPDIVSSYENPKEILLSNKETKEQFDIIFKRSTMEKEIHIIVEKTEENIFNIINAEIVDDYRNTKRILEDYYNNPEAILSALVENRLSADTSSLLDLID